MTVDALRRRRPETLGDLLETYGHELQAVGYLILRDRAEAEDVVIETLLTAFERGAGIRDAIPGSVLPDDGWLDGGEGAPVVSTSGSQRNSPSSKRIPTESGSRRSLRGRSPRAPRRLV